MNLYSATALTPRTWIHLAATYDGATVRLYVNGTQASSAARTGSLTTSTNPLQIGGDNIYGQYFNGTIDEIRIYNVVLTQAQTQSDMNTPISSLAPAQQIISGVTSGRPTGPMATAQPANWSTAGLSQIRTGNSGIACAPKAVTAGGQAKCTIQMAASPNSTQVRLESSSEQVRVPSVVATRANQSSLTFLASVAPDTKLQEVTIAAALADGQVEDSILALPSDGPVLGTPAKQFAKFGGQVSFTVGVADPSGLPVQVAPDGVPSGASFDPATNEFTWVPRASQRGQYRVVFTATNTAHQRSTAQVRIDVDSGKPELTDSPQVACSPNAIASVTGKWLSTIDRTVSEPSGRALQLGGTQVRINGEAAPILSSSPTKVSFLCPGLTPGTLF